MPQSQGWAHHHGVDVGLGHALEDIHTQLIDATTGHHLWAERYDRDLDDIFAIQDEITREIVVALEVRLSSGEQARIWSGGTKNVEAWECVRLGKHALNQITADGQIEARRLLKRAADLDANYPMAWASLGWLHFHEAEVATGHDKNVDREAALGSAIMAAQKAIELDPSCADDVGEEFLLGIGTVFDHVKGKVELDFTDQGEHQVKNIPGPLRVYSVDLASRKGATTSGPWRAMASLSNSKKISARSRQPPSWSRPVNSLSMTPPGATRKP